MTCSLQDHISFVYFIVTNHKIGQLMVFLFPLIMLHVIIMLSLSYHALIGLKEAYEIGRYTKK